MVNVIYYEPAAAVKGAELKEEFGEIDLTGVKQDLSQLISVFEELEKNNENYCVDEAKLTVGVIKDKSGKLKAGIAAKLLFLSGEAGGEKTQRLISRQLIEVTIRRKEQAP